MSEAEKLARRILECTEEAGIMMFGKKEEPWGFDTLSSDEQRGFVLTAKLLIEKGYVYPGTNLWSN